MAAAGGGAGVVGSSRPVWCESAQVADAEVGQQWAARRLGHADPREPAAVHGGKGCRRAGGQAGRQAGRQAGGWHSAFFKARGEGKEENFMTGDSQAAADARWLHAESPKAMRIPTCSHLLV